MQAELHSESIELIFGSVQMHIETAYDAVLNRKFALPNDQGVKTISPVVNTSTEASGRRTHQVQMINLMWVEGKGSPVRTAAVIYGNMAATSACSSQVLVLVRMKRDYSSSLPKLQNVLPFASLCILKNSHM